MRPHPLTNFEIQKYYQNDLIVFIQEIIYKGWGISLDEYRSITTHWISLYANAENVTYFDSFGFEHIPKGIRKFIRKKDITTNMYRIQAHAYDSITCGYFYIGFIDLLLKGKRFLEYTNLFSPNNYEKNDKIMVIVYLDL